MFIQTEKLTLKVWISNNPKENFPEFLTDIDFFLFNLISTSVGADNNNKLDQSITQFTRVIYAFQSQTF
jgi:hypothetical protein